MIDATLPEAALRAAKKAHDANIELLDRAKKHMRIEHRDRADETIKNLQQQVREIDAVLLRIENRREVA